MTKVLVGIPCFNDGKTLSKVVKGVKGELNFTDATILVVDDGSTDNTLSEAEGLGCLIISHTRNRGVGLAFQTAVRYCLENNFDYLLTIDADNQFDPADLKLLLDAVSEDKYDFCSGSRFLGKSKVSKMPLIKKWGNGFMSKWLTRITKQNFTDVACGLRAYNKKALMELNIFGNFTYTQEVIIDLALKGLAMTEKPISVEYFPGRQSSISSNLFTYAARSSSIILRTYRDYFPLKFFWSISASLGLTSMIPLTVFFENLLRTGQFSGGIYAAFIAAAFLLVSLAFWFVGLSSEQLGRLRVNQERILRLIKNNNHLRS